MLVLFISDGSFGRRENEMLRRLEIGLLDEGVRVLHAVPQSIAADLGDDLTEHIIFPDAGPRLMRPFRIRRLVDELAASLPASTDVDIVHAWGGRCWTAARELAIASGATLAVEVWSGRSLDRAQTFEVETSRVAKSGLRGFWSVPSQAMLRALRKSHPTWPVHLCQWGTLPPDAHRKPRDPSRPITIGVIATGVGRRQVSIMLEGLAKSIGDRTDVLIFLDEAPVSRNASIWRLIRSLNLGNRLSVISDLESRRAPTRELDVLAIPESLGEHRTIILDAMASRCTVIAQADPLCDYLIDNETAIVITDPTASRWQAVFDKVLTDADFRDNLGHSAARYVARERAAHAHVESLLAAYRAVAARDAIPFAPA